MKKDNNGSNRKVKCLWKRDKLIHIVIIHIRKKKRNIVNKYFEKHFKKMDGLPFLANYKMFFSAAWSSFEIKYFEV